MLDLPGYRIIDERTDGRRRICRAYDEQHGRPVVIEALDGSVASLVEIARLRLECWILSDFKHEGVIEPYRLERHAGGLALVREDCGGRPLSEILAAGRPPLPECLRIGVGLGRTLDALHRAPILHKNIQPACILINEDTGTVKLTGFGRASRLAWEYPQTSDLAEGDADLAYISPEQTGRMYRTLDDRSDLYSLGVTLYQMLTGRLPFTVEDPVELIHCHLTTHPESPSEIDGAIPEPVSAVVMKLLHKSAEDRYQSAAGLVADLAHCLAELRDSGEITDFLPGREDRRARLSISQSLYGRDNEREALLEAFARSSGGNSELVVIAGDAGVGKTSLVHELHEPVVHQRGSFVSGKFERFKQDIPYNALTQAFRMLIRQVQHQGPERCAVVGQRLREALGSNGRVLVDVIPELADLVGELPPVAALSPTAALHRFHRAFRQLARFFAQPEHPLVVFLDDMHWADAASLRLVHNLVTDPESGYLLVIGAYRSTAVDADHALTATIDELRAGDARMSVIEVAPLSRVDIGQMVCDTLLSPGSAPSASIYARIEELVGFIYEKTGGNPLHVIHLLECMHEEGLLRYEPNDDAWQWSTAAIRASGCAEQDVVEIMSKRLRGLPEATQTLLGHAACLGASFELGLLVAACGAEPVATARQLWEALETGLILPMGESYKLPVLLEPADYGDQDPSQLDVRYRFTHDRAQRAAYYLGDESGAAELHLSIGRRLLADLPPQARDNHLFAIASQLGLGREALSDPGMREDVAELELQAARRARLIGAHEVGLVHTTTAMELLGEGSWLHRHDLTLALYMEAIADAHAVANYERASKLAEVAMRYAEGPVEQAAISAHQIESLLARGRPQQAIEIALHALQLLDVPLRLDPPDGLTPEALSAHLIDEPWHGDSAPVMAPGKALADRILATAWSAHRSMGHETAGPVLYTRLHLCAEGATPRMVADVAGEYAVLLCGPLNDIERGYHFGRLALELIERFGIEEARPSAIRAFFARVHHWVAPLQESIAPLRASVRLGLDHGDPTAAARAALDYCMHLFFVGEHLSSVEEQCVRHSELADKLGLVEHVAVFEVLRTRIRSLVGVEQDAVGAVQGPRSARTRAVTLADFGHIMAGARLFVAHFYDLVHAYLFEDFEAALDSARRATSHAAGAMGRFVVAEHNCFHSLALLARCEAVPEPEREALLHQVAANQAQMAIWAHQAPANFQFRYDLVAAEQARVLGQREEAAELYERAARGAAERGALHFEAMSMERMAALHRTRGDAPAAEECLRDAHSAYLRWGAQGKAQDLESLHGLDARDGWSDAPVTVVEEPDLTIPHALPVTFGATQHSVEPDLMGIIAASQAISRALEIGQVLARSVEALVAHTDARRGLIALLEDGRLVVEASWEGGDVRLQRGPSVPDDPIAEVEAQRIWPEILLEVAHTQVSISLGNASVEDPFQHTSYARMYAPRSVLCVPLRDGEELYGVLYMEEDSRPDAFTEERVSAAHLLATQIAISIGNSRAVSQQLVDAELRMKKEREEQNEALAKEAWALAKLTIDKEKFLSLMSHDLKNALNQIVGMTDVMLDELEELEPEEFEPDEFKGMLEKLGQTAEGCTDLLINLLTWSRLQSGGMALKPDNRDLHALVEKTVKLLDHTASRKEIKLENAVERETWIHADPNMVDTIIRNLVGNSLKFTPRRGRVIISARVHQADGSDTPAAPGHAQASGSAAADRMPPMIAVSVRDTGVGIKPEDLVKLFRTDVHHTTKGTANEKGSGFGLTMCQEMVKQNGGDIWVTSELGKGTTFIFTVPAGAHPEAGATSKVRETPGMQPS